MDFIRGYHHEYTYDDGYQVMASSTKEWFTEWIRSFDEAAHRDEMYVLGIFVKKKGLILES